MAKRKSKYYAYGFEQGKQAAHDTDWQPNEMQNAYDNDTLGEIAGDILDNYRQYAGTVYYQDLTDNQLDKFEDGFFTGFQNEVEKILKQKKILNPKKSKWKRGPGIVLTTHKGLTKAGKAEIKKLDSKIAKLKSKLKNPNLAAIRKMKRTAGKGYKHRPVFYSKTKYALGTRPQKRVLNPGTIHDLTLNDVEQFYNYENKYGDQKTFSDYLKKGYSKYTLYSLLGAYATGDTPEQAFKKIKAISIRRAKLAKEYNFNPGRKQKTIHPIGRNIDEISGNYVDEMNKYDPERANKFDRCLSDMLGSGVTPKFVWQYAEQEIDYAKKHQKKIQNPGRKKVNSAIKDYAAFARKDKVKVSTINIPAIKQLIEIGDAFGVLYKSDKFSKGNPKFYEHRLKKHGKIYLVNTTKNAAAILMTGLKINMKPEGLVG